VVSFRGSDLTTERKDNAYAALFRTADRFLPVSDTFRNRLVTMGCPPEKVEVHRSGIDLRKFRCVGRTRVGAEPMRLLSIARLVEKKGIGYALEAVARVAASGRAVRYDVIGDGPLRPALERKSGELGVRHLVRFLGTRDHVQVVTALDDAHALLQPSVTAGSGDQEGIPNVLKEAMASGLPVVSTRHSGIPELVEHDVSGFLVPERDVDALVDRIAYLADHPGRWPEMGRAGRKKVEREYDRDRLNRRLMELYGELVAAGANHG
jgi:colanic acid/amylovoran biosynthesis glycosyltransferase